MNMVTAIIQPFKLEDVREALEAIGVRAMTVTDVYGYGRQLGQTEIYRGAKHHVKARKRLKIEVAIADDDPTPAVEAIWNAAWTGHVGDGRIFVSPIAQIVHIRARPRRTKARALVEKTAASDEIPTLEF